MKDAVKTVEPAEREARFDHIRPLYLEALTLVERLHRRLLDVIKDEFDRRGRADINSVQALLLYNIGDKELTAGELRTRGYYLGSNVSYNLKKLVETRLPRPSAFARRSPFGPHQADRQGPGNPRHRRCALPEARQDRGAGRRHLDEEFATLNKSLHRLERFWTDQILYRL